MALTVGVRLDAGTAAAVGGEEPEAWAAEGFCQDRRVRSEAAGDEADADLQAGMSESGEADEIKQVLYNKRIHPFIGK